MIQDVINGFKQLLADFDPVDAGECDANLNPVGSTAIQVSGIAPVAPSITDAVLTINVMGMTTADEDPDKTMINTLFSGVAGALEDLTVADIAAACSCQAELWILQSVTAPSAGPERFFTITYNLTIQDFEP